MMRVDLKGLGAWSELTVGEVLAFDAPAGRRVRLSFNASGRVSVLVSQLPDMSGAVLLAHAEHGGMFEASYSADGESFVQVVPDAGAQVFVAGHSPSHVVELADEVVMTSLEPQGRRNTDYDRMVQLMHYNERRREQRLEAELSKIREAARASAATESTVADDPALDAGATDGTTDGTEPPAT